MKPTFLYSMKLRTILVAGIFTLLAQPGISQVPQQLNYQGRFAVGGVNFNGTGQFKFALVDAGVNQNQTPTANATVAGGEVTQIFRISMGSGYVSAPVVTISNGAGSNGTGATAVATLGQGMGTGTGPTDSVYQITVTNSGSGYMFAIVTIAPPPPNIVNTTYWSNDFTSIAGSAPAAAVSLPVTNGLYSVALGDTALASMTAALSTNVFQNPDVRLRVWFDDGTHGSQLLSPDQKLNTAPYAFVAGSVPDGAITSAQLANGAVDSAKLAANAVGVDRLNIIGTASAGKVLSYGNGGALTWATPSGGGGGGLSLPFYNNFSDPGATFGVANDNGDGIYGETSAIAKSGVFGRNDVAMTIFNQPAGQGVYGYASHIGVGVLGVSEGNDGISGRTNSNGKSGVFGYTTHIANGVAGISEGGAGVYGQTTAANQSAVYAYTAASNSWGVNAIGTQSNAIVGTTNSATAAAIYARSTANNGLGLYVEGKRHRDPRSRRKRCGKSAGLHGRRQQRRCGIWEQESCSHAGRIL